MGKADSLFPEVEKSDFSCFLKTCWNTDFWKVYLDFLVFQKKLLQYLYPFWFYVDLNTAFSGETKIHTENYAISGHFFIKTKFSVFK